MPLPAILVLISRSGPGSWRGINSNDLTPPLAGGVSHMFNTDHAIVRSSPFKSVIKLDPVILGYPVDAKTNLKPQQVTR